MSAIVAWSGTWGDRTSDDLIHAVRCTSESYRVGWGVVIRTPTLWVIDSDLSSRLAAVQLTHDLDRIAAESVNSVPTGVLVHLSNKRLTPRRIQPVIFEGDRGRMAIAQTRKRGVRQAFGCEVYQRVEDGQAIVDALTSTLRGRERSARQSAIVLSKDSLVFATIDAPLYTAGDMTISTQTWNGPREPERIEADA